MAASLNIVRPRFLSEIRRLEKRTQLNRSMDHGFRQRPPGLMAVGDANPRRATEALTNHCPKAGRSWPDSWRHKCLQKYGEGRCGESHRRIRQGSHPSHLCARARERPRRKAFQSVVWLAPEILFCRPATPRLACSPVSNLGGGRMIVNFVIVDLPSVTSHFLPTKRTSFGIAGICILKG